MQCAHCQKPTAPSSARCAHCGALQTAIARPPVIACPHCAVDTDVFAFGSLILDICADCGGTWFDTSELRASHADARALPDTEVREALRARLPRRGQVEQRVYVACPVCQKTLIPRAHPHLGGVVAHTCVAHGAWVSRTSLLRLLAEVEKHGAPQLAARQERLAQLEKSKLERERAERIRRDQAASARGDSFGDEGSSSFIWWD